MNRSFLTVFGFGDPAYGKVRGASPTVVARSGAVARATGFWIALALAASVASAATAQADRETPVPPVAERAPEFHLPGEIVTLPLVMVREFPFVDASIQGVPGKLMLDTGAQAALSINDHRVPIEGGRKIGTGFFESGQTFDVRLASEVHDVRLGALVYPRVTHVAAQDARMLERITPDFIGWLGFQSFKSHTLKLDYQALQATFYPNGGDTYLEGERVIAELPFETRRLPNHPIMAGRVGELELVVTWDTGQQGGLYTTEAGKARLLSQGLLTPSATDPESFDLKGLMVGEHTLPTILTISVDTVPSPAAPSLGITEPDEVTLGYGLLHQFKTVWDFERRRIYLLHR